MFSLFKKDKAQAFDTRDKVWRTEADALKGLLMMAMLRLQQKQSSLIFTFFEEEKQRLISFMSESQISFKEVTGSFTSEELNDAALFLCEESLVNNSSVTDWLGRVAERMGRTIYFPSHYPLTHHEDKLLTRLSRLGYSNFNFCLSFDDPTLKQFGATKVLPLLEKLGLEEHEAIEHDMVTRSIKNARLKIDEKVKTEIKAKSSGEWFALNIKS